MINRDYDFLIDVFKDFPYELKIYSNKNEVIAENITMSGEILGNKVVNVMRNAEILVIPLKDKNILSGQLTILHAMQLGVPVIATDFAGVRDFIIDGENGYLIDNDIMLRRQKISFLLNSKEIWDKMSNKAVELYEKQHTVSAMAKNIGAIIECQKP